MLVTWQICYKHHIIDSVFQIKKLKAKNYSAMCSIGPYEPKLFEVLDIVQTEDPNQIENE